MRVEVTPPAFEEIGDILAYIAASSPNAARSVARRIDAVLDHLGAFPDIGRETDWPGIRAVNTNPYPYLVFYEVVGDLVSVLSVRHGARDPEAMPAKPSRRS